MTTLTTTDGTTIHFDDTGEGEPLLLLHGFGGTGRDFAHVFDLEAFAQSFRVVTPDARGHGRSTDPARAFSFRRCGEDVIELLDHLGIERARAVGVSLGAKTLLHVATRVPGRIERMILVSAASRFPESTRALMRASAKAEHPPEEWERMRALHVHGVDQIERLFGLPAKFADEEGDHAFDAATLRTVRARTWLVAGDRDPLYPVSLSRELLAIPRSELWVVPGGTHSPIFGEVREEFERRAIAFLGD